MLPKFPEFKKLELSDQEDIEKITSQYEPYSDFNFANMWAWDVYGVCELSVLHHNLVIRFFDPITQKQAYSYLGQSGISKTVSDIFNFFDKNNLTDCSLKLVPEVSLAGLDFTKHFIEIDMNSCDYMYDLVALASLSGNKYSQKRGRSNNFKTHYPTATVSVLDLHSPSTVAEINELNYIWMKNKSGSSVDLSQEMLAIDRFISSGIKQYLSLGVYVDKKLIGYTVFSFHGTDNAINLFIKGDMFYVGVYEFVMQLSAQILMDKGYKYMNYQEDLGIDGLRRAKLAFRPTGYLRKYFIKKL